MSIELYHEFFIKYFKLVFITKGGGYDEATAD